MAAAQLKLSRRALLGAACAAPFTAAASSPVRFEPSREAVPSSGEALPSGPHQSTTLMGSWLRALARLRRAEAAVAALEGTPDDDAFNHAADALDRALERLLRTPAPHISALAAKLDLAVDHQAWELRTGHACMAALALDAQRLS